MAHKLGETDESDRSDENDASDAYSRRSYLTIGAAMAAGVPSAVGVGTAAAERDGLEFRQVCDAVDDLGMDPTGVEPVDAALDLTQADVLIRFPEGTYRFDPDTPTVELCGGAYGFEGAGRDVSFLAPEGHRGPLLECNGVERVYLGGIDIDQTADNAAAGLRLCGDHVVVRDVEVRGPCDVRDGGYPLFSNAAPDGGTSTFQNVVARDEPGVRPAFGRPGIFLERAHTGVAEIRDCDLRHFPDAAVHASGHAGTARVIDSYFENNAAAIRLAGEHSAVRRCEIVLDGSDAPVGSNAAASPYLSYGIAIAETAVTDGQRSRAGVTVKESSVRVSEGCDDSPALVVSASGAPLEVVDCEIEYDADAEAAVLCRAPGPRGGRRPIRPLRLRGLTVTGEGSVEAAIEVANVDGCEIEEPAIRLPQGETGISLSAADSCLITDTDVSVGHLGGSDPERERRPRSSTHGDDAAAGQTSRLVFGGDGDGTSYAFSAPDGDLVSGVVTAGADSHCPAGALRSLSMSGTASLFCNSAEPHTGSTGR